MGDAVRPGQDGARTRSPRRPAQTVTASYLDGSGFAYAKAGGWTAVSLPYAGGKLTMTALLPPAGSGSCTLPTQARLAAITASLDAGGTGAKLGNSVPGAWRPSSCPR